MSKIIVVAGPTASGKTALSIHLAKKYNAEVINADAQQVYKDVNIGTAKITKEEMENVKHHLLDFIPLDKNYSVTEDQEDGRNVLNNLINKQSTKSSLTFNTTDKIKIILNYINEHFAEDISINTLATLCDYSEYHFMRFFKKHIGLTCIQYINNLRLEKASILLTSSNMPITDISLDVGFDNLSYFNKLFKRKYKLTPKEFRLLNSSLLK